MKTIYEWLLHNTENEGNHITILNVKRSLQSGTDEIAHLDIMGRTKDFEIVNIIAYPAEMAITPTSEADWLAGRVVKDSYVFENEQGAISFLREGSTEEARAEGEGIHLVVAAPSNDVGSIAFPPDKAD